VARRCYNFPFVAEEIKVEKWLKMGRGREEDRGEPGAVAPEQNRALGRYVAIWTTNPDD
jgi:hypothetical protein